MAKVTIVFKGDVLGVEFPDAFVSMSDGELTIIDNENGVLLTHPLEDVKSVFWGEPEPETMRYAGNPFS